MVSAGNRLEHSKKPGQHYREKYTETGGNNMFCTSCGGQLFGGETFCPYCGAKVERRPNAKPASGTSPHAPENAKPGLQGFAKGWTIFAIVLYSAYIAQNLINLFNPGMVNLMLPALILLGLMDFGSVLTLRMNPYGFYIQLGASLMFLTLSGATSGRNMISTSGGIIVLVSWMVTKDQLDYSFMKKKIEDLILLEGFEKTWTIFIIGYLTCHMLLSMMNIGYYNYYSYQYVGGYLALAICGIGAIAGGTLILNKRSLGLWVMAASILIRVMSVDSRAYGDVFRMSDAAINRLGLVFILSFAPALLTWFFTRGQIQYFGTAHSYSTHNIPSPQAAPSSTPQETMAPASQETMAPAPQAALIQEEEPKPTPPPPEPAPLPTPREAAPPKPVTFVSKKTEANGGTYEVYSATGAIQAQEFLSGKTVSENNYFIVVKTPEGNWGKDILGIYLENLLPYQYKPENAVCECRVTMDFELTNLCAAAMGANDNFVATLVCGKCGQEWKDGLRYQNKTAVRCHHCGALNVADSTPFNYVFETNTFLFGGERQ